MPSGRYYNPLDAFRGGRHGMADGPIDIEHFSKITSGDTAWKRFYFLLDNEGRLRNFHNGLEIDKLWKAVYRGCAEHDVPIPDRMKPHAKMLGVIVP